MKRLVGSLLLVTLMVSRAWAQTSPPPDPWNPPHPAPPPGHALPPPYAPPPHAPPPAPYGAPNPYAGWGGNPYGVSPQAIFIYENEKKNPGIALLLNFILPGIGSIYADHAVGALITWGLIFGGIAVMVWGINQENQNGSSTVNPVLIVGGPLMMITGVIYSYVDSYTSSKAYNRALARRLGLPEGFALGPAPFVAPGQATAWGPALSFRF